MRAAAIVWGGIGLAAAWLLLPLMVLQFLSGYAILHPRILGAVMGKMTAFRLHGVIQPLTMAALVLHGFPWVRRRLARQRIAGRSLDVLLTLGGAGLVAFGTYLWILG
jgi:hypothetical protein